MSKLLQIAVRDQVETELTTLAVQQGSTKTQMARQFIYEGLRARGRDPVALGPEGPQLERAAS